jgi:hypothetical protein
MPGVFRVLTFGIADSDIGSPVGLPKLMVSRSRLAARAGLEEVRFVRLLAGLLEVATAFPATGVVEVSVRRWTVLFSTATAGIKDYCNATMPKSRKRPVVFPGFAVNSLRMDPFRFMDSKSSRFTTGTEITYSGNPHGDPETLAMGYL